MERIKPRKGGTKKWVIGTWDIETKPAGTESSLIAPFCMGATCEDTNGKTVKFHYYLVTMLAYMLGRKDVRWFCHNGGNFDFKYILNDPDCMALLEKRGYEIQIIGGDTPKALMFKRGHKTILFCDSYKLMQQSLDKLSRGFGVATPKGKIDFDNEDFNPENPVHLDYLRCDVISLWQVVNTYRGIINTEFNTEIKCTASSTAFACWQTMLPEPVYHHSRECNDFARSAYFGARTECFAQGRYYDAYYIDVNSLYAYIMYEYGGLHRPYYTETFEGEGFYKIAVEVPDKCKFGPVPYRKKNGGICFPVGVFETTCSSLEIRIAQKMGCKVRVINGYAFDVWDKDLFKPFIEKCKALRARDYNGAYGQTAKFMQNNLYGFFGMNPERTEIVYSPYQPDDENLSPMIDQLTGEMVDNFWIQTKREELINCIPAFAAWITSAARAYLLSAMLAEEEAGNRVLYCDTDSIIMQGYPVSRIVEGEYGAFKLEYKLEYYEGVSAKTYILEDDTHKSIMRCKGIPAKHLRPDMYESAGLGVPVTVEYTQLNGIKQILQGRGMGRDDAKRTMPSIKSMGNRTPNGGDTLPLVIKNNEQI